MEIKLVWEMVIRLTGPWSVGFLTPSQKKKKDHQIRHVIPTNSLIKEFVVTFSRSGKVKEKDFLTRD